MCAIPSVTACLDKRFAYLVTALTVGTAWPLIYAVRTEVCSGTGDSFSTVVSGDPTILDFLDRLTDAISEDFPFDGDGWTPQWSRNLLDGELCV